MLLYAQAVDYSPQILRADQDVYARLLGVPSVAQTGRLPGIVLLHVGMRVRLTTQILPPWAVQDAPGTVMEIDVCPRDRGTLCSRDDPHLAAEIRLTELPLGVYVKLDRCSQEFLPPCVCQAHMQSGFSKLCPDCRAFEGWVLVEPITRSWSFTDSTSGATLQVQRTGLALMPEAACPLHSLQGATCEPGLIAR